MRRYELEKEREGSTVYFFIRDVETLDIVLLPTKYLMHKIRSKCSPNTVRRSALAILYYLEYIHEKKKELTDVYQMPYVEQTNHFVEFLYWLKAGKHTRDKNHRSPNNGTCNAYLRDVFRFYLFIEEEYQQFGELKVLSYNYFVAVDAVGVKKSIRSKSFKGYLKEEEHKARAAKKDEIVEILKACTNIRDRLLMLLLAETGYRIGEILGIDYSKDIDYQNHIIRVYFREDNENGARAKNAEYRSAKISKDTFGFLNLYIAEYRKLLQHQTSLFVNISGDNIGKPMNVEAVYSMLKRNANGYFDSEDSEEARYAKKQSLNTLRTQEYCKGEYSRAGGCVSLPVPEDAPFFVKDYSEYYKGRCYHKRSLNSNDGWNSIGCMSFKNQPILKYSNEIRSAVLIVHGEKAHSYYFGKDAYENMIKDSKYTSNKELLTIPGAVHADLYDNLDVIPFDKIQKFFEENGVG